MNNEHANTAEGPTTKERRALPLGPLVARRKRDWIADIGTKLKPPSLRFSDNNTAHAIDGRCSASQGRHVPISNGDDMNEMKLIGEYLTLDQSPQNMTEHEFRAWHGRKKEIAVALTQSDSVAFQEIGVAMLMERRVGTQTRSRITQLLKCSSQVSP